MIFSYWLHDPFKSLCIGLMLALCIPQAMAFDIPFSPEVTNIDKYEYGALSKNWAVSHDHQGYLYFGNDAGLLVFNGADWELHALPSQTKVRSVLVASDNRIYTGSYTEFGYWQYDRYGDIHYTSLSDSITDYRFHNEDIWKIVEDADGNIYFQSFAVIFRYDGHQIEYVKPSKGGVNFLLKARDRMVISHGRGTLSEVKGLELNEVEGSEALQAGQVRAFLPWEESGYLIGSAKYGLFQYNEGLIELWNVPANELIKDKQINCGVFNGQYYFIGTIQDGLYMVDQSGEVVFHFNGNNYLPDNTVLGLDIDLQGRIILSLSKGISIIDLNYPISLYMDERAKLGTVYDVAVFQDDLYLATNRGVFKKSVENAFNTPVLTDFERLPKLGGQAWSLHAENGKLLCGHNKGTFQISADGIERISLVGGGYSFQNVEVNNENYLLQNNYTSLAIFKADENGDWAYKSALNGFSEPSRNLAIDAGNIWATHSRKEELYKISFENNLVDPVEVRHYKKADGLPQDLGIGVFKFKHRIIFTTRQGIYTYDDLKDSIVVYDQLNAPLGEFANAHRIIKQNEDSYWFVLPRKIGLFNWKSNQLEKVMEYYFNDPRMSLVEKFENIVPITNQHSIICLEQGVALIRNELVDATAKAESLRFKRITYTYKNKAEIKHPVQDDPETLRIPYRGNQVSFEVTSVHSSGKQLLYSFNLNGLDHQWSKPEATNGISFSRLPWGKYNLKVRAFNAFGNVVGSGNYHFEIIPLWYTRFWVIALFVLLVSVIVFVTVKKVKRHNQQKQERLLSTQHKELMKIQEEQRLLTEKEIVKLRNDNLRKELAFKSNQLASATMASIRKNEVLMELKQELIRQKEVLQYRFPEKYFEKLIRMIERDMTSNEDWDTFEKYFDQAHVNFFSRLKEAYPAITPKDLRLCAYLKMNLTTKEIAPLLSVSPRSVEVHRYRLRKRLELKSEDNLTEFLIAF